MKNYRDLSTTSRFAVGLSVLLIAIGIASSIGSAVVGAGGGSFYVSFFDEGVLLTQRSAVNWLGAGITCADNAGTLQTDCTVSGGGGGSATTIHFGIIDPNGTPAEFTPRNMTNNTSPAPFVASATNAFGGGEPYFCFAGTNTNQWWLGGAGLPLFIQINLGSTLGIASTYSIQSNDQADATNRNRAPKDWTLQGSADGSTWNVLDTVTGQTSWAVSEERSYTVDVQTTAYQYYRINVTDNNEAMPDAVQISKIRIYPASSPFTSATAGDVYYRTTVRQFYGPYDGVATWPSMGTLNAP